MRDRDRKQNPDGSAWSPEKEKQDPRVERVFANGLEDGGEIVGKKRASRDAELKVPTLVANLRESGLWIIGQGPVIQPGVNLLADAVGSRRRLRIKQLVAQGHWYDENAIWLRLQRRSWWRADCLKQGV